MDINNIKPTWASSSIKPAHTAQNDGGSAAQGGFIPVPRKNDETEFSSLTNIPEENINLKINFRIKIIEYSQYKEYNI